MNDMNETNTANELTLCYCFNRFRNWDLDVVNERSGRPEIKVYGDKLKATAEVDQSQLTENFSGDF